MYNVADFIYPSSKKKKKLYFIILYFFILSSIKILNEDVKKNFKKVKYGMVWKTNLRPKGTSLKTI